MNKQRIRSIIVGMGSISSMMSSVLKDKPDVNKGGAWTIGLRLVAFDGTLRESRAVAWANM